MRGVFDRNERRDSLARFAFATKLPERQLGERLVLNRSC